jgi:hypothetical protein
MSRFVIGIDLGTTNSCVFYADTTAERPRIHHFKIPQLNAHDHLEHLPSLASYYLKGEYPLPWDKQRRFVVGQRALAAGEKVPTRLVQSAKSWLCHAAAARQNRILPPEAPEESDRISPVEASKAYLSHLRESWNHAFAKGDPEAFFEEQEIVLTVPASFDEGARMLTLEAAKLAGLRNTTLLEEPQAAFYAWIEKNPDAKFSEGTQILVADVGGGTTDFSLIAYSNGTYSRQAVGDHLLLGGDNIDQTIAHAVVNKLKRTDLTLTQWLQLRHEARKAKESLYSGDSVYRLHVQGGGSKVVAGGQVVEITREELDPLILNGFFPILDWEDACRLQKKGGLTSMGLPYETEPAITKHLASFYRSHTSQQGPDFVLFNGGSFKPEPFRNAILSSLRKWFPNTVIAELPSHNLDLAVGLGACYYGLARRGIGTKISGGSARTFYMELQTDEGEKRALTLLPRGVEEGYHYRSEQTFKLKANTGVSFQLYSSHVRIDDTPGKIVAVDPLEMHPLPPIQTHLRFGKGDQTWIPVHLEVEYTTLGTLALQLRAIDTTHVWKLEFQLKAATGQEDALLAIGDARQDELLDQEQVQQLQEIIKEYFVEGNTQKPFYEPIEEQLQLERHQWPVSLLRAFADTVLEAAPLRQKSPKLRQRWWNALGYFLRPGLGYPLDDFRIKSVWKCFLEDRQILDIDEKIQFWIALRRISGGLSRGQQQQVAADLLPGLGEKVKAGREEYALSEKFRLIASLEWLDRSVKLKWGTALVNKIVAGKADKADFWSLGRFGARILLHAPISSVLPVTDVTRWIERLLESNQVDLSQLEMLLGQLGRKTDHREINLPESVVAQITEKTHSDTLSRLLTQVCEASEEETTHRYGDRLPPGLKL